jgi:TolA-binding protein
MNDLKHWREEGAPGDFERLLRAAQSERPSSASVQRALVVTGIIGAGALTSGAAAGAAGGAAGKAMTLALAKWFAIGAIGAGAVIATSEVVRHRSPRSVAAPANASSPAARVADQNGNAPRVVAASAPKTTTAVPSPMGDSKSAVAGVMPPLAGTPSEQHSPATANPDRTLLEEMALIDAARSSLRTGDASGALRSANQYGRRFPAGRFAPEALFLVMQANGRLGNRQGAVEAAREIVRRYPNGAQVARARELLQTEAALEKP